MTPLRQALCPQCGRRTRTVRGLCPHCGLLKTDSPPVPATRRWVGGSFGDDVEDMARIGLMLVPGLVIAVIAVFVLGSDLLLVVALVALVAALVAALGDWL